MLAARVFTAGQTQLLCPIALAGIEGPIWMGMLTRERHGHHEAQVAQQLLGRLNQTRTLAGHLMAPGVQL